MPFVEIYLRKGKTPEYCKSISKGVHAAMRKVFQLPEDDYFHVVHELEPNAILHDPTFFGIERGSDTILIRMAFNHRPPAQKASLFEAVAGNIATSPGVRREDVFMMIVETAAENWWAHGRSIDPESGFDIRMSAEAMQAGHVDREKHAGHVN
ncbi:tautomerase family protein [Streptomyces umbrinus]|uniref:tautomerase family protein n=1 Tax=Streptomyces umbrinus TaxID=67370 RepID=UPI003C2FA2A5